MPIDSCIFTFPAWAAPGIWSWGQRGGKGQGTWGNGNRRVGPVGQTSTSFIRRNHS